MNLTDRSDNLGGNDIKRLCLFYVTNVHYSHIFSVLQAICTLFIAALMYILLVNTIKVGTPKGRRFSTHTHTHTGGSVPHRYLRIVLNYHEMCLNT